MAEDEDYGVGQVRIELDASGAESDARTLGERIERALLRAVRNTGRQIKDRIESGLSGLSASVAVTPNTRRFRAALTSELRDLEAVAARVAPETERFRATLTRELRGLDE